jgi:[ribosomal protein S5]-alanine N-acetyltransferase
MNSTSQEIRLRRLTLSDKTVIAQLCNNKNIWNNLTDRIPFPYLEKDAEVFIRLTLKEVVQYTFGITYKGDLVGVIGLIKQKDVYRLSAEVGYWIGEPYWGLGIATKAARFITDYAFERLGLIRVFSAVFDFNKASQRVLQKAGFKLDCIFEKAVIKNDVICDEYRYSIVKK